MTPKNILLLEDDPLQSQTYRRKLMEHFHGATVMHLETESDLYAFVTKIKRGNAVMPDAVVADVMMPWAQPSKNSPAEPAEVKKGGFSRAGVRCLMRFRGEVNNSIPWYLFTILDQRGIENEIEREHIENAVVMNKERPMEELFQEMENRAGIWRDSEEEETKYLLNMGMKEAIVAGLATAISACSGKLD